MRSYKSLPRLASALSVLLLGGATQAVSAQSSGVLLKLPSLPPLPRFGPDLLQTLGVGARAVAMGSAFTAEANDSTATFWNPAALGVLIDNNNNKRQFDLEYRTVVQDTGIADQHLFLSSPTSLAYPNPFSSATVKNLQFSYAGLAYPLSRQHTTKVNGELRTRTEPLGVLAISYALGGYANIIDRSKTIITAAELNASAGHTNLIDPTQLTPVTETDNTSNLLIRNTVYTLAYGSPKQLIQKHRATFRWGLGLIFAEQDQQRNQSVTTTQFQTGAATSPTIPVDRTKGFGLGAITGFTYRPLLTPLGPDGKPNLTADKVDSAWSVGLAYRSVIHLHGLDLAGHTFNRELPDRLALGLGYETFLRGLEITRDKQGKVLDKTSLRKHRIVADIELQRFGDANHGLLDERRTTVNLNMGLEYVPNGGPDSTSIYRTPIRFGFRTLTNADTRLFSYDNVISVGLGLQIVDKKYHNPQLTVEGAVEYMTNSSLATFTLSTRLRY